MHIISIIAILLVVTYALIKFFKYRPLTPFLPYKYNFGKRRVTFKKALALLTKTNAKVIVETGTSRLGLNGAKGDGASTIVFGKWAKENDAFMHSVDISEDSVKNSQAEVNAQQLNSHVKIYLSDSIKFLEDFEQKIDFLYLDSYDYSRKNLEVQKSSQEHHLKEFKAAKDKLHENTIVLIDDCRLPNGGKGKTVIAHMLKNDWKILLNAYQVLLVKKDSIF